MNQDLECPYCEHWDEASPDYYIDTDFFSEHEHKCSVCKKTYLFMVDISVDFRTKAKEGVES